MRIAALLLILAGSISIPSYLLAQREMYGMGGTTAEDQRRQLQAAARQQVSSLLADYESAYGSRDVRALAQLYAREAVLWPGDGGEWRGRDSLAAYFARVLPTVAPMRSRIVEFRLGSELAWATLETVRPTPIGADSVQETFGTDVMLLERDPLGDWAIVWHLLRPERVARREVPREAPRPPPEAAAGRTRVNDGASPDEARRGFQALMQGWKAARELAAFEALYAEDALLVTATGVPVRGRAAIALWSAGAQLDALETTVETVRASGNLAYLSGTFTTTGGERTGKGTFIAVLIRDQGRWRIQSQVFLPQ
ncbi:MAG TPA: nuclear transport factor 2 family protein [Longimicrobium sp.]